jgi:hypothetical protein
VLAAIQAGRHAVVLNVLELSAATSAAVHGTTFRAVRRGRLTDCPVPLAVAVPGGPLARGLADPAIFAADAVLTTPVTV